MAGDDNSFKLTADEVQSLARDGFVVRPQAFDDRECDTLAGDCEALVHELTDRPDSAEKVRFGNYLFERRDALDVTMKWEPDAPELIQGLEPVAHLSPALERWSRDPRLVEPCRHLIDAAEIVLFTEKINFKRARNGGDYIVHQDYPYWKPLNPDPARIATAMIFLDDARVENGCLEVAPASHLEGEQPCWPEEGGRSREIDTTRFDTSRLVPVEAARGAVVFFGSLLVHRSGYNRTGADRRALLYSYQPAGLPHARDVKRRWTAEERRTFQRAAQPAAPRTRPRSA